MSTDTAARKRRIQNVAGADWRELALTQASKKERKFIYHSHNKVSSKKTRFDGCTAHQHLDPSIYLLSVHANVPTRTAIGIAGMDRIVHHLLMVLLQQFAQRPQRRPQPLACAAEHGDDGGLERVRIPITERTMLRVAPGCRPPQYPRALACALAAHAAHASRTRAHTLRAHTPHFAALRGTVWRLMMNKIEHTRQDIHIGLVHTSAQRDQYLQPPSSLGCCWWSQHLQV